jgi:hypothetical protein
MPWTNSIIGIHTDDMVMAHGVCWHPDQTVVNLSKGSWDKFQVQSVSSLTNLRSFNISVCFIQSGLDGRIRRILSLSIASWDCCNRRRFPP